MYAKRWVFSALAIAMLTATPAIAAGVRAGFSETIIATGLAQPTTIAFAPDGRLFVAEQRGAVRVIKDGVLLPDPFLTVEVSPYDERGLLGITFDPQFETNHFVYIYYTATTPAEHNRVSRFTANGDVAVEGSEVAIFDLPDLQATTHNGGSIHFGPDGMLYIAVGENGEAWNAQSLDTPLGKMLRIRRDGSIPDDNPYVGFTTGINRAIWAMGLRNPFKFSFDPFSGRMLINDVGEDDWEEIDDGIAGVNYGWPETQGFSDEFGLTNPLYAYSHAEGCAITGSAVYPTLPSTFPADYAGGYFFADFCGGWIRRYDFATGIATEFATGITAPVDIAIGPDGSLYYLGRGWIDNTGVIGRIDYTGDTPPDPQEPPPDDPNGIDIGTVKATGSVQQTSGTIVVKGSGADVWGTVDAFHGRFTEITGNFDVVVRVARVDDIDEWTKAGLMIRDGAGVSARHAFLFVTPAGRNGVAFQRRTVAGGFTAHTAGPALSAPVWLQLSRRGDSIEASSRVAATDPWQRIDADSIPGLPQTVLVGLAVTSHQEGVLASATFDGFSIQTDTDASVDVGSVAVAGDSNDDGSVVRVRGSGADIWSTADAFHWRYTSVSGDFDAEALVTSVDAVRAWTKAGLMIRAGLQPNAAHMSLFATPGHGVAFQRRRETGGISFNTGGPAVAAPVWLRLSRRGSVVYASYRLTDTDPWTFIDADAAVSFGDVVLVGLAVSSHSDGLIAEGDFEQFTITPVPAFTDGDIGAVSVPGMMASDSIVTSLTASGADIWNSQDAFHFYRTLWHGDGSITTRVLGLVLTDPWAKAGVMFRSSLDPASPHVMLIVSGSEGISLQSRSDAGGESQQAANVPGTPPTWLRLLRAGDDFSAYASADGVSWMLVGTTRVTLGTDVYVGLAVTSHDDSTATRADFDHISALH